MTYMHMKYIILHKMYLKTWTFSYTYSRKHKISKNSTETYKISKIYDKIHEKLWANSMGYMIQKNNICVDE